MLSKLALISAFASIALGQSTAPQYGQCGGQGWAGATVCPSGWSCIVSNPYYSQCLPGAASSTPAPPPGTTAAPTTAAPTTPVGGSSTPVPSGTSTAAGVGATLLPNNLWIRADEEPIFHHYLQSSVLGTASTAVLGDYTTAAQFQLNNGQVEQQLSGGSLLYLTVLPSSNASATYLATAFTTTPNTWGTWSFSGDGLNWSAPNITRSNTGAFLACGSGDAPTVNVNLGAYDYMTPAGCADETLNYYNGATAVD